MARTSGPTRPTPARRTPPSEETKTIESTPEPAPDPKLRMAVPLLPDGKFDWSTMREKTAGRLTQAIAAENAKPATGLPPSFEIAMGKGIAATTNLIAVLVVLTGKKFFQTDLTEHVGPLVLTPSEGKRLAGPVLDLVGEAAAAKLRKYEKVGALVVEVGAIYQDRQTSKPKPSEVA